MFERDCDGQEPWFYKYLKMGEKKTPRLCCSVMKPLLSMGMRAVIIALKVTVSIFKVLAIQPWVKSCKAM